jgi:threonine/homoserine/homoserine lactone efflux protein
MLGVLKINFPAFSSMTERFSRKGIGGYWDVLLLGILFALAFCPYSGVLYFGMLIPLTISSNEGILLPFIFAVATGITVIIFAWLIAYTVAGVGNVYNKVKAFEIWFRRMIALVFIGIGIYYILIMFVV